ncbi:MAG: quinone-dependent dihydroorotate dehydrogenase [Candidatus Micrarchaeota archaeon]|nr:quinone-dependent dihydroorotate dehydrogenase [Candidatus Micrarchaeota archaeon]
MAEPLRMRISGRLYSGVVKPIYFKFDPEDVHNRLVSVGKVLGSNPITRGLTSMAFEYNNPALEQRIFGLHFRNPVGLSAGFDKNGDSARIMRSVGFGFTEIGSITAKPCAGNPGVRLKRLKEKRSILVHMGLNNRGAGLLHEQLMDRKPDIPTIISAAKTNCKETTNPDVGLEDYLFTVRTFRDIADVFELNISCPNAFGGQDFADPRLFERLAKGVNGLRLRQPVIVKLSPDLTKRNVDRIIEISARHGISGFVCTNLTKRHDEGEGGLSGKAVEGRANDLLSHVYKRNLEYRKRFVLIGVGGIFSAEDAYGKIKLGANLVELITGMIYQGPQLIGEINYGLAELLERDGYSNIGEAVGTAR